MKSMKRMVRGSSFFPIAQVSAALLFFLALSSSTESGQCPLPGKSTHR